MNSLPHVGGSRSRPPRALREAPQDAPSESDSGVFQLFESAVLVFANPGEDLRVACTALETSEFTVVFVPEASAIADLAFLPRFALVETALPGALDFLRSMSG